MTKQEDSNEKLYCSFCGRDRLIPLWAAIHAKEKLAFKRFIGITCKHGVCGWVW